MKFSKELKKKIVSFVIGVLFGWVAWGIFIGAAIFQYLYPVEKGILFAVIVCVLGVSGIASAVTLIAFFFGLGDVLEAFWAEQE